MSPLLQKALQAHNRIKGAGKNSRAKDLADAEMAGRAGAQEDAEAELQAIKDKSQQASQNAAMENISADISSKVPIQGALSMEAPQVTKNPSGSLLAADSSDLTDEEKRRRELAKTRMRLA